jgi:hypothetical protein
LNEEDKKAFERKMESDSDLAEEYARQKEIYSHINAAVNLRELMNDPGYEDAGIQAEKAVRKYEKKKQPRYLLSKKFFNTYVIPIAASIAALFYIGNLAFFIASPDLAFQKYYKDYTPVYYAQASVDEAQALLVHSFDQYNKGNYEAVAKNMHTLMEEGKLNVRGQIMLAFYDAWNLGSTKKVKPDDTNLEDATWYLALTFYKLGDYEKAQSLFKELSTKDYRRAGKAARMERKVSKMLLAE